MKRLPNGLSKMTFAPAISYQPGQGYSDFEDRQIESENRNTSNASAEVIRIASRHDGESVSQANPSDRGPQKLAT
jgi:hypothetical protein